MSKKIIVGSKNPVKIEATKRAFERIFPSVSFVCKGHSAPSGVPDQPMGHTETLKGAKNRAVNCKENYPEADFFCGIESGIVEDPEGDKHTTAWAVVLDKNGNLGKGISSHFMPPPKVMEFVAKGHELGTADDIVFAQKNSKQAGGSIGILTNGAYTREEKVIEAVMCALVPHKNTELYFREGSR